MSTTRVTSSAMDNDSIGTNESSSTMMDVDTTTTTTAAAAAQESLSTMMDIDQPAAAATTTTEEDMDLLTMEMQISLQDFRSPTTIAAATAAAVVGQRANYKFTTTTTTTDVDVDFGLLRRNIRHVDTKLRSLAKEPYPVRHAAAKDLYEQYRHLTRTLDELRRQGVLGAAADGDKNNIDAYVRHVKRLQAIVVSFGTAKDFSKGLERLERVRLPEPRVIRIGKNRKVDELGGLLARVGL